MLFLWLVFDSIFQKNEMRNKMKNESKTVTVNDTNESGTGARAATGFT